MDLPFDTFREKWQIAGGRIRAAQPARNEKPPAFSPPETHATQITANQAEKKKNAMTNSNDMVQTLGTGKCSD